MLDILHQGDYRIVHLTDGELLSEAVKLIDKGKADGINLNYIRNWRTDLEPLRNSKTIKCLTVNDYPPSMQYDYSAVQTLTNLQHLSINTTDKKEIDFSAFPNLTSVALTWRPKAKSFLAVFSFKDFFLIVILDKI